MFGISVSGKLILEPKLILAKPMFFFIYDKKT